MLNLTERSQMQRIASLFVKCVAGLLLAGFSSEAASISVNEERSFTQTAMIRMEYITEPLSSDGPSEAGYSEAIPLDLTFDIEMIPPALPAGSVLRNAYLLPIVGIRAIDFKQETTVTPVQQDCAGDSGAVVPCPYSAAENFNHIPFTYTEESATGGQALLDAILNRTPVSGFFGAYSWWNWEGINPTNAFNSKTVVDFTTTFLVTGSLGLYIEYDPAPVPEPATLTTLFGGVAVLGLLSLRRHRRA